MYNLSDNGILAKFTWAVFWVPKLECCSKFLVQKRSSFNDIANSVDISFLKSYGFSIIGKTFFTTSGAKLNLTLNISIAIVGYGDES